MSPLFSVVISVVLLHVVDQVRRGDERLCKTGLGVRRGKRRAGVLVLQHRGNDVLTGQIRPVVLSPLLGNASCPVLNRAQDVLHVLLLSRRVFSVLVPVVRVKRVQPVGEAPDVKEVAPLVMRRDTACMGPNDLPENGSLCRVHASSFYSLRGRYAQPGRIALLSSRVSLRSTLHKKDPERKPRANLVYSFSCRGG